MEPFDATTFGNPEGLFPPIAVRGHRLVQSPRIIRNWLSSAMTGQTTI